MSCKGCNRKGAINKAEEIMMGWKNFVFKDPKNEIIAKYRLEECLKCLDVKHKLGVYYCGICKCPIAAKARSPKSKCPATPPLW